MRESIKGSLFGFCFILLTAVSSIAQEANKPSTSQEAANKSSVAPATATDPAKSAKTKSADPVIACTEPNSLKKKEIVRILFRHNEARTEVKAPDIIWDCSLAQMAQEWATRGVAEHRPDNYLGENLFVSSDPAAPATLGVKRWVKEKKRLEPGTMKCKPGKMCLHYTQVVSPDTLKIGCGINRAATGKWKVLMVCNYDPAGNMGMGSLLKPRGPFSFIGL